MAEAVSDAFFHLLRAGGNYAKQVPGLDIVISYIENSYQNDPFRVLLEAIVTGWMLWYLLKPRPKDIKDELTPGEIEELVNEWEPEPLVPSVMRPNAEVDEATPVVIKGEAGLHVVLEGGERLQNWASADFLGLQNNPEVTENAIKTVRRYGVGACGPAGFYGSMDVHLKLENEIARLLQVEEAIVYSQGFMAVASVIPAFCKRGDIIVADGGISFAAQTGLEISRSEVYFFRHNDMDDLIRVLDRVNQDCKRKKMPLSRRFIVVEGLYAKTGDKCPLPKIMEIKNRYKYRLILDESFSFGCLGTHGLGVTDFYEIPASSVEIITGSFSNCLGSSGGFCAGSHTVVDHQRLSSQAYCFSAALPALLAASALLAMQQIEARSEMLQDLRRNIAIFNSAIGPLEGQRFQILGDHDSPLRFVRLAKPNDEGQDEEVRILGKVIEGMRQRGYLLTMPKHAPKEKFPARPAVKICISAGFSEEETRTFSEAFLATLKEV